MTAATAENSARRFRPGTPPQSGLRARFDSDCVGGGGGGGGVGGGALPSSSRPFRRAAAGPPTPTPRLVVKEIPYSLHSSFDELAAFVAARAPGAVQGLTRTRGGGGGGRGGVVGIGGGPAPASPAVKDTDPARTLAPRLAASRAAAEEASARGRAAAAAAAAAAGAAASASHLLHSSFLPPPPLPVFVPADAGADETGRWPFTRLLSEADARRRREAAAAAAAARR